MKKSVFAILMLVVFTGMFFSCSEDKKEGDDKEKKEVTKPEDKIEKEDVVSDEEACLDVLNSYKQAVMSSIELIKQVTGPEKKSLEENLSILQNALTLQQEITALGQKDVGEKCWKDFLTLQLQFVESLIKIQDKLKDGDVLSAFLESMKDIKDAKETIEDIKALVTE